MEDWENDPDDVEYLPDEDEEEQDEEIDYELEAEERAERAEMGDSDDDDPDYIDEEEDPEEPEPEVPIIMDLGLIGRFLGSRVLTTRNRNIEVTPAEKKWWDEVTEPQPVGEALLRGGEFGRLGKLSGIAPGVKKSLAWNLMRRKYECGRLHMEDTSMPLVPNSNGTVVAEYGSRPYAGQYSADASFFYTCLQDFRLHIYDTITGPVKPRIREEGHETSLKPLKTIYGHALSWTITDSHLSADGENLIYASMTPTLYMAKTRDPGNQQIPLRFSDTRLSGSSYYSSYSDFCLWSCRFSADGKEIVAGGSAGDLYVYDLGSMRRTTCFPAHSEDVNSCCWADAGANVLISGSDDTFCKVWDRRSLRSHSKPAGVLVGHTEGITYVNSKGDGRYVISNGKDQALRLWDLRKMRSNEEYEAWPNKHYGIPRFDYRQSYYPKPAQKAHPKDCSIMTYRGHSVLKTLIRCHFSPTETTGGKYIYSGSADGKIHIWSLDGRVVQVIDRGSTLPISYDPSDADPEPLYRRKNRNAATVRDVSWHPEEPVLMSVAWRPDGTGSLAKHEFKGFGKDGRTLEDAVETMEVETVD